MNIYQQIVNQKLKTLTPEDLMKYGKQYDIDVTKQQATNVLKLIRKKKNVNIFNPDEKNQLLREIARVTSPEVARKLNQLFIKFTS
jgi:Mn-dependent DtxR family transcriptional regulator